MGQAMLKKSTLARMRLAALAAAATTIAVVAARCGKEPATSQPHTRSAHVPGDEDEATPLAGNDGGKPKPKPDPCSASGMG